MNTQTREELERAIEGLYRVFARYPLKAQINACPHCVFPEDHQRLSSKPLRELTFEDVGRYARKAITTWGDEEDFKHFLPRIFELMALDPAWNTDVQVTVGKLRYASWSGWPDLERSTITNYLHAWWLYTLHSLPDLLPCYSIDGCVQGVAQAIDDLKPFLEAWRRGCSADLMPLYHLADYLRYNEVKLIRYRKVSAWGNDSEEQMKQVYVWLMDDRTLDALRLGYVRYNDVPIDETRLAVEEYTGEPLASFLASAIELLLQAKQVSEE